MDSASATQNVGDAIVMSSSQAFLTPMPDPAHQIRLLKLPSRMNLDGRLALTLASYDRSRAPSYHAISYTWGAPYTYPRSFYDWDTKRTIACNDHEVQITQNLFTALEQICTSYGDIFLWNDALCIDQLNEAEKFKQIYSMNETYAAAALVIVWTGPVETGDRAKYVRIFATMHKFYASKSETLLGTQHNHSSLWSEALGPDDLVDKLTSGIFGFLELLSRTWWARLWTWQELWLARSAVIWLGPHRFECDGLFKFGKYLSESRGLLRPQARSVINFRLGDGEGAPTLVRLQSTPIQASSSSDQIVSSLDHAYGCHNFGAALVFALGMVYRHERTEERDLLLSLIGPARFIAGQIKQPVEDARLFDCSTDIELFTQFSRYTLLHVSGLEALAYCGYHPHDEHPSWVLNMRGLRDKTFPPVVPVLPTSACAAGAISRAQMPPERRFRNVHGFEDVDIRLSEQLGLRGVRVGQVSTRIHVPVIDSGPIGMYGVVSRGTFDRLVAMMTFCQIAPEFYWKGGPRHHKLWSLLFAETFPCSGDMFRRWASHILAWRIGARYNVNLDQKGTNKFSLVEDLYIFKQVWVRKMFGFNIVEGAYELLRTRTEEDMKFWQDVLSELAWTQARQSPHKSPYNLFVVEDKYPGVSGCEDYDYLEDDDEVWILEGGKHPFILRSYAEPSQYRLIGRAYVDGIMDGEFVDGGGEPPSWQDIWLV